MFKGVLTMGIEEVGFDDQTLTGATEMAVVQPLLGIIHRRLHQERFSHLEPSIRAASNTDTWISHNIVDKYMDVIGYADITITEV